MTFLPPKGNNQEREEILTQFNELRTTVDNPPGPETHKTRETTQWGPAGVNAILTCGQRSDTVGCVMFTPDEHTNYSDGHCELGWRTFSRYTCNEHKPNENTGLFPGDEQAGDTEHEWRPR